MIVESNLKAQLNGLKYKQKAEPVLPKNTDGTFLFDFKDSKRIDNDIIYEIGYNGIIELSKINDKFIEYISKLFGPTSKYYNREMKTEEEIKSIDLIINSFLVDLIPFFLIKHTHKVMEFLIKIYKINVYNSRFLISCFIPYCEVNYFVKLIQNVNLSNLRNYEFMYEYAKNGLIINTDIIYKEMFSNFDLIKELFDFYEYRVLNSEHNEIKDIITYPNSFFTFLYNFLNYILKNSKPLNNNLMSLIIKFINSSFTKKNNFIIENICQIIVMLISKITITYDYQNAIFNDLILVLSNFNDKKVIEKILQTLLILVSKGKDQLIISEKSAYEFKLGFNNFKSNFENFSKEYSVLPFIKSFIPTFDGVNLITILKICYLSKEDRNVIIDILFNNVINENDKYFRVLTYFNEISELNPYIVSLLNSKDTKKFEKIKNILIKLDNYREIDTDLDLLLKINDSNINTVINSIKLLDTEESKHNNILVDYSISSVIIKFDLNTNEIVLMNILCMKNISSLLNRYIDLRECLLKFFYKVLEKDINIYSNDFMNLLIKIITNYCIDTEDKFIKVSLYLLVIYNHNLDSFTFQKINNLNPSSFYNWIKINKQEKLFIETLFIMISLKPNLLNIKKIIDILDHSTFYITYEKIINISHLDNILFDYFCINLINCISSEDIIINNDKREVINRLSIKLILLNKKEVYRLIFKKVSNIQVYISNLILNETKIVKNILDEIDISSVELTMINSLLYTLSISSEYNNLIMDFLKKIKKIGFSNYNNYKPVKTNLSENDIMKIIKNVISHSNEISVNKNNLIKLINNSEDINIDFYLDIHHIYLNDLDKINDALTITKLFQIFTNKTYKFKEVTIFTQIYKNLLNINLPDIIILVEKLLFNLINSTEISSVVNFIVSESTKFSSTLIEALIDKLSIIDYTVNTPILKSFIEICRIKYFITSDKFNNLNTNYIDLISNTDNISLLIYIYDIMIKNKNYFSVEYIIKTIEHIKKFDDKNDTAFLSLCNNLLNITINTTIDDKKEILFIIKELESIIINIIKSVDKYLKEDNTSFSIIIGNTLNVLFLCLNHLIKNDNIDKNLVKNIVITCFNSLNVDNKEISFTLIKSLHNFIHFLLYKKIETNEYYKYINYFVKFSLQYVLSSDVVEEFLYSLLKTLYQFSKDLTASFLIELVYYNSKYLRIKSYIKYYSIISNDIIDVINFVLSDLDKYFSNNDNFLSYSSDDSIEIKEKLDYCIDVLHHVLSENESKFFEKSSFDYNKLSLICTYFSKIKNKKFINTKFENFQDHFFDILNESKIIQNCLLKTYESEIFSSETRNYFLTKYMDIMISNEKLNDVKLNKEIFIYFLRNYEKEENNENIQMIFSILTKIITNSDAIDNKTVNKIILNIKKRENSITKISMLVFVSKLISIFENNYIGMFNSFYEIFLEQMNEVVNQELADIIFQAFDYLSNKLSGYFSSQLNETIFTILTMNTNFKLNTTNKILINISQKQFFDNSFQSVKYCLKNNNFNENSMILLFEYLKNTIKLADKLTIADMHKKIFKFFIKCLLDQKLNLITPYILECFQTFILKINEKQLKTIFSDLINFATEETQETNAFKYILDNCIISFELINVILSTIKNMFIPYYSVYRSYLIELINFLNATFSTHSNEGRKKKPRAFFEKEFDENQKSTYINLNTLILHNIRLNFTFNDDKLQHDHIEELIDPIITQLKFVYFEEEKILKYFDNYIKPCIIQIFSNIKNEDLFKELNDSLLNLIREDEYLTKILTLKTIDGLFKELKERYVTQMTDIIPYVSECIEDSNEKVHNEAFRVMKNIEKITGEDLKNYLDS